MSSVIEQKRALRRDMKARLASLGADAHHAAGEKVRAAVATRIGGSVALFASTQSEISTAPLDAALRAARIARATPALTDDGGALVFRLVPHDIALHDMPRDRMGIPTPDASWPLVVLARCDLVVVPGLAFDKEGGRLGYGRGYYDRALTGVDLERCIAVLHDVQLVEAVPREPHDVRLRWLCTPALGVFATSHASARGTPES